ncbi:MAG: sulfatase-like hydrolase/transferase, partial [Gemmatimonadetes bacterium]|nr:sulfatase-like hydrolase/transferase [Gemmatimonadota bacterium]
RMPSQHGVHDWIREGNTGPDAATYLEGEVAYTDVLAAHGYTVGLSGKWHLGNSLRVQHGHSHWYVHQSGGGRYNDAPMIRDGRLVDEPGYVTNRITDDALGFLDRHADDSAPFYLGVHYTAPHSPWTGHPQQIVDSYADCDFASCPQEPIHPWSRGHGLTESCLGKRDMLQGYFAAVTAMDLDVGRLLDKLEARGLRDDTLVIFASDNGFSCGHHGFWGKGNGTFPLNMYENSVTVPFLVSQPGSVPAAVVESGLHGACDLFPTLLQYLGLPIPDGGDRPGQSFAGLLSGPSPTGDAGHESLVVDGVSQCAEYGASRMVRTTDWKFVDRGHELPGELYHLTEDPDERHNLIDDSGSRGQRAELHGVLLDWFARYGAGGPRDGRLWNISGGGQLRPVGGERQDHGPDAFSGH